MLKYLKDLLTGEAAPQETGKQVSHTEKLQIATCALFIEVAKSDENFSQDERDYIVSTLQEQFELTEDEVNELMNLAEERVDASVSLYEFTDVINQHFSKDEKFEIVKNLWRLIFLDENLDKYEEHFIRIITNNFHLEHKDLIDAKMMVKEEFNK
jgi:uncharacterized tellurite resistance protein B-like protein